jgi:hypothetical protein
MEDQAATFHLPLNRQMKLYFEHNDFRLCAATLWRVSIFRVKVMKAQIGRKAQLLQVSNWVQGVPVNFDQLSGRVILEEVFQVNCPGLFFIFLAASGRLASTYSLSRGDGLPA